MLFRLFSSIINRPFIGLFLVIALSIGVGQYANKLEIDASSETLMLDDDKDLKFARKMAKRFQSPDFLVVTFSPNSPLLSQKSLQSLQSLSKDLQEIPRVSFVTSILNVPLLESPVRPVTELTKGLPNILSKDIDKTLAKKEFLNSPLYKNNLVSEDFKTTALIVGLKSDKKYFDFLDKRNALLQKEKSISLSQDEKNQLEKIKKDFKIYRDKLRLREHENIEKIRQVLGKYKGDAKVFLGGVSMIANDMIDYVKSDIILYGVSLLVLLILALGGIFRQIRWVLMPIFICTASVLITTGFLGFLGLEITVISSNFISLQLIITLSITIHLIVQYQEFVKKYTKSSQNRIILASLLAKSNPSFFSILTTIVGFGSLVFSGIKPIINLGLMMSIGIGISLIIGFVLFASINAILPKKLPKPRFNPKYSITQVCANLTSNHKNLIINSSVIILIVGLVGASRLQVENSFINYFKSSTEIYKGMQVIDQELGGTTPLDVIVTFKEKKKEKPDEQNEFSEFEDEFEEASNEPKYWFSRPKMELASKIGDYLNSVEEIGNVQSLDTMLKVGKNLNDGRDLDSFQLAVLYEQLPEKFKNLILNPYVNIENNQLRFSARIIDSNPDLRRDRLIKKIDADLEKIIPKEQASFRLSSFMILYNNMLQSLYKSQILTLGFVVLILFGMFWILFRSLKVALIAMASNLIPMSLLFGFMGLAKIPLDMMSITIAAITIGMGVDNTIHYIYRFKYEFLHLKDYKKAMFISHKTIAYAMFYTSFVIVLGFSVLVVSNFIPTIYFGLLTVFAMSMVMLGSLILLPRLLISYKPF